MATRRLLSPAALVLGGTVAVSCYVVAQAGSAPDSKVTPLWNWWGLTDLASSGSARGWFALLSAVTLVCWFACWWGLFRRAQWLRPRHVLGAALGWGLPLLVGPPLLSLDAYAYIAQGKMIQRGLNPYRVGPSALGHGRILAAVDPLWRHAPTPYGPLLLRAQAGAVQIAGHHPVLAIFEFRALVVCALGLVALFAARSMSRPTERIRAWLLVTLNPVVLVYLLSGAHLDALMAALVVLALIAARSGQLRLGLILGAVAVAFKMPALVVVGVIAVSDLRDRRGWALLRRAATDSALVVAVLGVCSLAVPDGFGWLTALGTPAKVSVGYAPAELMAGLVHLLLRPIGVGDSAGVLLAVRVSFAAAGALFVGWLCLTVGRRGRVATTVLGLLTVALAAPVLYGWYLSWGLLPAALIVDRVAGRRVIVAATLLAAVGMVPDLHLLTAGERHLLAGLCAAPAVVAVAWSMWRHGLRSGETASQRVARWRVGTFAWVLRRRLPRWSIAALVAAGALSVMSTPAVAVPGSVRQIAELLSGDPGIAHAWLIGSDYYVLLPAVPVPEQASELPIVITSDGGSVVPRCAIGPMPTAAALPSDPATPAVVYVLGNSACWRPAPANPVN
ncbi:MAG: polyprenol phosphomannose-dependent alpha 1,6 mannosyltransferase MptB [Mycobacteriales bacterium]